MTTDKLLEAPPGNYKSECREIFRKHFVLSGGDPARVDAWFNMIDAGRQPSELYAVGTKKSRLTHISQAVSDYDDSPAALGSKSDIWSDI